LFASEITVLEERPVLGPKAAEEAEPTDLDLCPDCRAILRGIMVGINRFAMGDGVDDVDEKTLEGEWGIRGVAVAVGAECLKEFGAPFYDCRSGTPKVVALAIDTFAEWAVS
jgi:hypothetical protein